MFSANASYISRHSASQSRSGLLSAVIATGLWLRSEHYWGLKKAVYSQAYLKIGKAKLIQMRFLKIATNVYSHSRTTSVRVGASFRTQIYYRITFAKNLTSLISWTSCKWIDQWLEITAKTSRFGQYNKEARTCQSGAIKAAVSVNSKKINRWHGSGSLAVLSFLWGRDNILDVRKAPLIARQRPSSLTTSMRLFARYKIKPRLTSFTSR